MIRKLLFLSVLAFSLNVSAQQRELAAQLRYCAFNTPDQKPYVETYLSVMGNSVKMLKNKKGKFQGNVEIFISFTQHDTIRAYKKYTLSGPELDDTTQAVNFLDLQRFPLNAGVYDLQLTLSDANRKDKRIFTNKQSVIVDFMSDSLSISNIQFLESYKKSEADNMLTKSGYDLTPYVSDFFPENMSHLSFYAEIYNTQKIFKTDEVFLVTSYIESAETNGKMSQYNTFQKMTPQKVNIMLSAFQLQSLPGGRYNLVIEVRDAQNQLRGIQKASFERFNPGTNVSMNDLSTVKIDGTFASKIGKDTIDEYIRSLRPISTEGEKTFAENRIKAGDLTLMQQYFYNFWTTRNNVDPEGEWNKYLVQVRKVNKQFSTQILKGYETDRGRVWLQYGEPTQRTVVPSEPSALPYEIWQYYRIQPTANTTTQTNKKFVFYNPDLVTNNFYLIHSDARGEIRDDRWNLKIFQRDTQSRDFDDTKGNSHFGSQSEDLFLNPR